MYRLFDGIKFMKSLPDKSVDGVFSDPPWGQALSKNSNHHPAVRKMAGQDRWKELLTEMTDEAARILKDDGKCFLWFGLRHVGDAIKAVRSLEYRWMFFCYFIPPKYIAGFECSHDAILYFAPEGAKWPSRRIRSLYQHISHGGSDTRHPCARPFDSVKRIIHDCFETGAYVIDPFAGSDTTGRACRELFDLRWDSCEVDTEMFETGIERHKQGVLFEQDDI